MPPPAVGDLVVGCATEDNGKYLDQTLRLLQSIRWFGGSLADARLVVGAAERLDARARRAFESLGAEIRILSRFHPRNPPGNRLQLFEQLLEGPQRHLLVLDCDTLVVRDPLPQLRRGVFQAKIEPLPTVTHAVFERLFPHFGIPLPPRSAVTGYTGTKTIPYFNSGVISIPAELAARLLPEWRRFNAALADEPELAAPCARHIHQAALALALASTGIPVHEADPALNFQLNATHLPPPPGYTATDPYIIHYHHLVDREGLLLPCPFPRAQERIDQFNERLLEERVRASGVRTHTPARGSSPRQLFVLGMPRAGTSLVTRLLHAMGCYAGEEYELTTADVFHPAGCWEHRDVRALDEEIVAALGTTPMDPGGIDVARLDSGMRQAFTDRARAIVSRLGTHGSFVVKDTLLPLLFPFWRELLERPVCVLVWRDPMRVARSFARRDGLPLAVGLALWEEYTRAMLAASSGLPRVLVSYDELAGAAAAAAALHRELVAAGAADVRLPSNDDLRAIAGAELHGERCAAEDEFLNPWQRELRDALQDRSVLRWESVPPAHPETRHLLAEHARGAAAHARSVRLQQELDAVFASRTWRLALTFRNVWRAVRP